MRRERPTENLLFFWLALGEGPGPFDCNLRDGAGHGHQFHPLGPEAADVHKITHCCANGLWPVDSLVHV